MKTTGFFLLVALWLFSPEENAARKISLADAVEMKLVSCNLKGKTSPDSLRWKGGHGLELSLQNNSREALQVNLETGRTFRSLDSSYQNLILTEDRVITLGPREQQVLPLVVYCLNQTRKAPLGHRYLPGKMADGMLLKLAAFLHRTRIFASGAQASIWVVSGNSSIDQVAGKTKQETRALRNFLYDLTGRVRPPRSMDPLAWPLVSVQGNIQWEMEQGMPVNLVLSGNEGSFMAYLFRDRAFPSGRQHYRFTFTDDALLPGNLYNIRLVAGDRVLAETSVTGR